MGFFDTTGEFDRHFYDARLVREGQRTHQSGFRDPEAFKSSGEVTFGMTRRPSLCASIIDLEKRPGFRGLDLAQRFPGLADIRSLPVVRIDRGHGWESQRFVSELDIWPCSEAPNGVDVGEGRRGFVGGHTYSFRGVLWQVLHVGEVAREANPDEDLGAFLEMLGVFDFHERLHLVLMEEGLDPDPSGGSGLYCRSVSWAEQKACQHLGWRPRGVEVEPGRAEVGSRLRDRPPTNKGGGP